MGVTRMSSVLLTCYVIAVFVCQSEAVRPVLDGIFGFEWTVINVLRPDLPQYPPSQCVVTRTLFKGYIEGDTNEPIYHVPHSLIVANAEKCGPLSDFAPEKDLYFDDHMLLVPGALLMDSSRASMKLGAMRRDLFTSAKRHEKAKKVFTYLMSKGVNVWVGYEATSDRICGGVTVLSRTSFSIFAEITRTFVLDKILDFGSTQVEQYYRDGDVMYMTFDESFARATEHDKICAFEHPLHREYEHKDDFNPGGYPDYLYDKNSNMWHTPKEKYLPGIMDYPSVCRT